MKKLFFTVLCLLLASAQASEIAAITLGEENVRLEVARSSQSLQQGLMFRKTLKANHGMLFCLKYTGNIAMWMKNTPIDLDAGFFDKTGRLFHVATMKANTLTLHHAFGDAHYVIEMNSGWFEKHGVNPGFVFKEIPAICKKPQ